jgi:hypothetical protein
VKTLNKAINPSRNTNPFNHDTSYIKLYDSVKDGTSDTNEYGQLINPRYLDDVFTFITNLSPLTRKVRIDLGRKELLVMKEVQVWDYSNVNRARGTGSTATQSTNYQGGSGTPASNAVDGVLTTISHTDDNISEYHISACNFPKYHVSC